MKVDALDQKKKKKNAYGSTEGQRQQKSILKTKSKEKQHAYQVLKTVIGVLWSWHRGKQTGEEQREAEKQTPGISANSIYDTNGTWICGETIKTN